MTAISENGRALSETRLTPEIRSLRRLALLLLGLPNAAAGAWAGLAPHSWYGSFPGFGRHWVEALGPYDEHLVRDFGFALAALGVLLIWAAAREHAPLTRPLLWSFLLFAFPHLVFHVANTEPFSTGDNMANLAVLGGSVLVPALLLVEPWRRRKQPRTALEADGARIRGVPQRAAGPILRLAYAISRRRFGRVPEPLAVVGHHFGIMTAYAAYELTLERCRRVDERLKELGVAKAATMVGCAWCLDFGSALLRDIGVSERQMREFPNYRESDAFSEVEKLVLDYAEAMSETPVVVPDELFARMEEHFDEPQIVELTAAIAFENYRARFNHALGIGGQGFSEGAFCLAPEARASGQQAQLAAPPGSAS